MLLMMMMIDTGQEALKMAVVCIFSLGRTDLKILFEHRGGGRRCSKQNKLSFLSSTCFFLLVRSRLEVTLPINLYSSIYI